MQKITGFFTELMRKYLPDPFVFAIGLTLLTMILAVLVQGQGIVALTTSWGKGFWTLLAFTTQMAVILAMGYVLATAPLTERFLDRIVMRVHDPRMAIIVATLVGGIGSYLNWGFGLVIGGIVARKLALSVKGVHYPLIIASAYSGFTLYGLGLSASIPVLISTKGHPMEAQMGVIPLSETIFSPTMLVTSLVVLITLPLLNAWLHPKPGQPVTEIDRALEERTRAAQAAVPVDAGDEHTFASRLNNSRLLSGLIGLIGVVYVVLYFHGGGTMDLNLINFIILFLGIILLGTPIRYVEKLNEGIRTISGIILQYPFYAGIMAIMASSGLVNTFSEFFVKIATPHTLPFWGLIS
ncbi:MAG TPA: TIGR00366 family protein, partial [Caballeronia sp.]|nr:TIGR00366 family protein [Caballeronia sp.]